MIKFVNGQVYVDRDDTGIYIPVEKGLAASYLGENVDIEHRPKLRDILKAVANDPVLPLVFPRIQFIKEHIDDEFVVTEHAVDLLHVSQVADYHYSKTTPRINLDAMDENGPTEQGFYPVVFEYDEEEYSMLSMFVDLHATKDGDNETYSISMTPLNELLDVPVVFGRGTVTTFIDKEYQNYSDNETSITMFNTINGILDDITFHGSEEGKKEVLENIKNVMDEIDRSEPNKDDDDD